MAEADDATTTALRSTLARVSRLLIDRASQLRGQPDISGVTHELSIDGPIPDEELPEDVRETIQDLRRRGSQQIILSGYVDVTPQGHRGAAWTFDVVDLEAAGWRLGRGVTLYPLDSDDIARSLPDIDFPNWRALASALPGLVQELLETPLPILDGD